MVVVRLGSLGDVVLATSVLEALSGVARVTFVTRPAYADLFEEDPRVERVIAAERGGLRAVGDELRSLSPARVLDLQGTLASHRLLGTLEGVPIWRVRKRTLARRLAVWTRRRGPGGPPVRTAYLSACEEMTGRPSEAEPRLHVRASSREAARCALPGAGQWVGVAPGSRWKNKRWPLERYVEMCHRLLGAGAPNDVEGVAVFTSADESELRGSFDELEGSDLFRRLTVPLSELAAHMERLSVLVTNDSGPLHAAEAVGTPVVALFGPTTGAFGFLPFLPQSEVLERALWCRPCHVHGGNRCPLIHHRCMRDITVTDVVAATHRVRAGVPELSPGLEQPGGGVA